MTAPWPARDGLRITGVRVVVTAPEGVNLVVVRIDTTDPGLYGLGCATFHQCFAAVVATVEQHVAGGSGGFPRTHRGRGIDHLGDRSGPAGLRRRG
jgi:hypothetical protein